MWRPCGRLQACVGSTAACPCPKATSESARFSRSEELCARARTSLTGLVQREIGYNPKVLKTELRAPFREGAGRGLGRTHVSEVLVIGGAMKGKKVTRRTALKTGAGAIGGMSVIGGMGAPSALGAAERAGKKDDGGPNVYESLGVKPIINAAGTITTLGGSLMPPEVVEAWREASRHFVNLPELQDRVGERIASLLGVEAALVTTGAAGAITVGTAAAITYRRRDLIGKLPLPPAMGLEVIRQKSHRDCYDRQIAAAGVKLVDVETTAELRRTISERTVMMMAYNFEDWSKISRAAWVDVAREHRVPTLLDAAADTPPRDRLWEYNKMGFDLVVFSGGKAMRGPQDAGLLLGRKELIEAAKLNTAPRCGTIGRGMKVSKEDMVAMVAAVERFLRLDHDAEEREWRRRIDVVAAAIEDLPTVRTETITPAVANQVPHLLILWDEKRVKITPDQVKAELSQGDPSIVTARVHGTGEEGFLISVFMLQGGEEKIVASRMREVLEQAAT